METFKSLQELFDCNELSSKNISLTIGNFDGVHKGHQFILDHIKKESEKNSLIPVIITFVPHPQIILKPDTTNYLIYSYDYRKKLLNDIGFKYIVEFNFNRDFSTQNPKKFLDDHLLVSDKIKKIFVGHDFAFGENKSGDFNFLKKECDKLQIEACLMSKFQEDNTSISSSIIRDHIQNGDFEKVNHFLTRKFFISGNVVKGQGRGKKIGFPTANIDITKSIIRPSIGVYVTITQYKNMSFHSITNVGKNPTFGDIRDIMIETNLFDFDNDIYGETINVVFLKKIRDEIKFNSVNDLISQIKKDVNWTKDYFSNVP